jgi:hypothetical protein
MAVIVAEPKSIRQYELLVESCALGEFESSWQRLRRFHFALLITPFSRKPAGKIVTRVPETLTGGLLF